ncbi:hypothetical protein KUTeg_012041 [Tegillarca granosa]|uniref:Uncharacterized protein n=1 Tax=Tegillarca granosa TaxID=220873 RepID=A0ABQ9EYD5_TEGGR|nr:hypothetical protein KUTeg_012041 [Tegillarca granosa]
MFIKVHNLLFLAVLHFNENSKRKQAVTSEGKPMFGISYPKSRKEDAVPKKVNVEQTFGLHQFLHQPAPAQNLPQQPQPALAKNLPQQPPPAQNLPQQPQPAPTQNLTQQPQPDPAQNLPQQPQPDPAQTTQQPHPHPDPAKNLYLQLGLMKLRKGKVKSVGKSIQFVLNRRERELF